MDYRLAHVLRGVVEEYIATGKPVGSERLLDVLGISVSSATIRNLLRDLEDLGYVEQPHTSAGRIPTDKGYRYYIDQLTFKDPTEQKVAAIKSKYEEYQHEYERPAQAVAKMLADMTHAMAITGWLSSRDIHGSGISQLFRLPEEEETREAVREISLLFDNIESYIDDLVRRDFTDSQVYIGEENPVFASKHTSMIVRTMRLPTGETVLLLLAGPKRMPYRRNMGMINAVASYLEHND
ncbi:MAG TPA: hypothetical protein VLG69_03015 [Candidatus Andersenbacteria bacterium]|nr:hypothetical protein [Candidatus Andersenbacteria bacterium]